MPSGMPLPALIWTITSTTNRAAEWMKDSEKNATGCATWYYRYSVALDVLRQAGRSTGICGAGRSGGAGLPWIWLHLGKLRAHFDDKSGALDAVKQGLKLEPGDYEFLTLKKRSKPEPPWSRWNIIGSIPMLIKRSSGDWTKMRIDKQCAIACIRVDEAGLAEFYEPVPPRAV